MRIVFLLLIIFLSWLLPATAQTPVSSGPSGHGRDQLAIWEEREAFFQTIQMAVSRKLEGTSACANSKKGMRLAISLTRDPISVESERKFKHGYVIEDIATFAFNFLTSSCDTAEMTPLVEELLRAESATAKEQEPGLAFSYLAAADYYLNRCSDSNHASVNFNRASLVIPKVRYENTHSYIPEKFAAALAPYEEMLAAQPLKTAEHKRIRISRIQQQARHINNVGNAYLKSVFGPPSKTGLREYEVNHAVEAYTKAINLVPKWAEPYRGRARAYTLLEKHDLAAKDNAKAKALERT